MPAGKKTTRNIVMPGQKITRNNVMPCNRVNMQPPPPHHNISYCSRPSNRQDSLYNTIPRDVFLLQILSRVPARSLVRFRAVCKQWNSLFQDPYFVKLQLNHAAKNPGYFVGQSHRVRKYTIHSLGKDVNKERYGEKDKFDIPVKEEKGNFNISNSCNGLFCLSGNCYGDMFEMHVVNPSTRESVVLPGPSVNCESDHHRLSVGLGLSIPTLEYKVVRLVQDRPWHYDEDDDDEDDEEEDNEDGEDNVDSEDENGDEDDENNEEADEEEDNEDGEDNVDSEDEDGDEDDEEVRCAVEVLTLGVDCSWRSIGIVPYLVSQFQPVYMNGCIYWATCAHWYKGPQLIISFDVCQEKFAEIEIPQFHIENRNDFHRLYMSVIEGYVCMLLWYRSIDQDNKCTTWKLKMHMLDQSNSVKTTTYDLWQDQLEEECQFPLVHRRYYPTLFPPCISHDGKVFLSIKYSYHLSWVLYDLQTKNVSKNLSFPKRIGFDGIEPQVIECAESIIPIPKMECL